MNNISATLVTPMKNEIVGIEALWQSIQSQTLLPDEWIIADNGSTDGTYEWLMQQSSTSPIPVTVLKLPGKTIAEMMNLAISKAQSKYIACCHAGTDIPKNWMHELMSPVAKNPAIEVVAGAWEAVGDTPFAKWYSRLIDFDLEKVDHAHYVPATRSMAFTKSSWEKCGKFPEWLPMFGEDTLFGLRLKDSGVRFYVATKAKVGWYPKPTLWQALRQEKRYMEADFIMGLRSLGWKECIRPWIIFVFYFAMVILGVSFQRALLLTLGFCLIDVIRMNLILSKKSRTFLMTFFVRYVQPVSKHVAFLSAIWVKNKLKISIPEKDIEIIENHKEFHYS